MTTLVEVMLVVLILISMIMILMLISHLSHPEDSASKEERDRLLRDVETRDRVITSDSVFHQFFARTNIKRPRD